MWERTRQLPGWISKEKPTQPYCKSSKVNGTHTVKADGHRGLLGKLKCGQRENMEESITG